MSEKISVVEFVSSDDWPKCGIGLALSKGKPVGFVFLLEGKSIVTKEYDRVVLSPTDYVKQAEKIKEEGYGVEQDITEKNPSEQSAATRVGVCSELD